MTTLLLKVNYEVINKVLKYYFSYCIIKLRYEFYKLKISFIIKIDIL